MSTHSFSELLEEDNRKDKTIDFVKDLIEQLINKLEKCSVTQLSQL
jgi:hypothetical protein